jgi:Arc/MetJ-type ribon-helix-helix transcriptional regulator
LCNGGFGVTSHHGTYGVGTHGYGTERKAITHGLRYNAELNNRVEAATKCGGFSSHSAFIRAAIERELVVRESGVDAAERRIGELGSHGPRNSQSADRAVGGIRVVDVLYNTIISLG